MAGQRKICKKLWNTVLVLIIGSSLVDIQPTLVLGLPHIRQRQSLEYGSCGKPLAISICLESCMAENPVEFARMAQFANYLIDAFSDIQENTMKMAINYCSSVQQWVDWTPSTEVLASFVSRMTQQYSYNVHTAFGPNGLFGTYGAHSPLQPSAGTCLQRVRASLAQVLPVYQPLVIMFTSGQSANPLVTIQQAQLAMQSGAEIIAITKMNYGISEELTMSVSGLPYLLKVRDMGALGKSELDQIIMTVCGIDRSRSYRRIDIIGGSFPELTDPFEIPILRQEKELTRTNMTGNFTDTDGFITNSTLFESGNNTFENNTFEIFHADQPNLFSVTNNLLEKSTRERTSTEHPPSHSLQSGFFPNVLIQNGFTQTGNTLAEEIHFANVVHSINSSFDDEVIRDLPVDERESLPCLDLSLETKHLERLNMILSEVSQQPCPENMNMTNEDVSITSTLQKNPVFPMCDTDKDSDDCLSRTIESIRICFDLNNACDLYKLGVLLTNWPSQATEDNSLHEESLPTALEDGPSNRFEQSDKNEIINEQTSYGAYAMQKASVASAESSGINVADSELTGGEAGNIPSLPAGSLGDLSAQEAPCINISVISNPRIRESILASNIRLQPCTEETSNSSSASSQSPDSAMTTEDKNGNRISSTNNAFGELTFPSSVALPPEVLPLTAAASRTSNELCQGSSIVENTGFNLAPGTCQAFMVCSQRTPEGTWGQHDIISCPPGLFWSQEKLTCVRPEESECITVQCRDKTSTKKMATSGVHACREYLQCDNGSITRHCCPADHVFVEGSCQPGVVMGCPSSCVGNR